MNIKIWVAVYEDNNGVKRIIKRKKSKSLVIGFIKHLSCQMGGFNDTAKDLFGYSEGIYPSEINLRVTAPAGIWRRGIVIGGGSRPVTINDYGLQSIYSSFDVDYGECFVTKSEVSDNKAFFRIYRYFWNNRTYNINVREVGLVSADEVLIDRTLLEFQIPSKEGRGVLYEIYITV